VLDPSGAATSAPDPRFRVADLYLPIRETGLKTFAWHERYCPRTAVAVGGLVSRCRPRASPVLAERLRNLATVKGLPLSNCSDDGRDEVFGHALYSQTLLNLTIIARIPVPPEHAVSPGDLETETSSTAGAGPLELASPGCDR